MSARASSMVQKPSFESGMDGRSPFDVKNRGGESRNPSPSILRDGSNDCQMRRGPSAVKPGRSFGKGANRRLTVGGEPEKIE
jgi:hypothetical protein